MGRSDGFIWRGWREQFDGFTWRGFTRKHKTSRDSHTIRINPVTIRINSDTILYGIDRCRLILIKKQIILDVWGVLGVLGNSHPGLENLQDKDQAK